MEESLLKGYQDTVKQALKMAEFQTALQSLEEMNTAFELGLDTMIIQQFQRTAFLEKQKLSGILTSEQESVENNKISIAISTISNDMIPKRIALKNGMVTRLKTIQPAAAAGKEVVKLEKIVGGKETFLQVAWFQKAMQKSKAVCRILADKDDGTGKEAGTGWLIAGGYIITNQHVLKSKKMAESAVVQFDYEIDAVTGQMKNLTAYKIDPNSWLADETLDVCRVKLIDNPAKPLAQWGILETSEDDVPLQNEGISIIQHPEASDKKVALGEMLAQKGMYVWYDAPTLGGSSGSPIFDKNLRVFALHHAGVKKAFDGTGIVKEANEGILWSEIAKFLARNPTKPSGKTETGLAAGSTLESTQIESGRIVEEPKKVEKAAPSGLPTLVVLSDLADADKVTALSKHLKSLTTFNPVCRLFFQNEGADFGDVLEKTREEILAARFVLAVVTPNFLFGDAGELLNFALENRKTVVPILVEKFPLAGSPLEKLKALPSNGKFVDEWPNANAAFSDVAQNLRKAIG